MTMHAPMMHGAAGVRWTRCASCKTIQALTPEHKEGDVLACKGCPEMLTIKPMTMVEWDELERSLPFPFSPVMATIPRDSAEADAAQELFVECGVKVSVLENLCAEPVSLVTTLQWWPKGGFKTIGGEFGKQLRPSQMPMWDCASVGGGKTVVIERALGEVAALYDVPVDRLLGHKAALNAEYGRFNNDLVEYWDRIATAQVDSLRDEIEQGVKRYNAAREKAILGCVAQAAFKLGDNERRYLMRDERNKANRKVKTILAKELRACGLSYSQLEIIVSDVVESVRHV